MILRRTLLALLLMLVAAPAFAEFNPSTPDTTWLRTYDEEFINWASPHLADFTFPSNPELYSEVLLYLTIGCPGSPGDCDPWDRYAWLRMVEATSDTTSRDVEIARFITPYDITGGSYPGTCQWIYDVTDYKFLLKDLVTLKLYIESWMGNDEGWLITCDFAFVHGVTELQPYEVVNLYMHDHIVYGDTELGHETHLPPVIVDVPADAAAAKLRITTTGHGQGNTNNCAEFCPKDHSVVAGGETFSHVLWKTCNTNTCSPQGGTWHYPRTGWCPGDKVDPWDNDVSHLITPGQPIEIDYNIQPYFNECSPANPDCVSGQTCADCEYNYNGHTRPNWKVMGQLILYRADLTAANGDAAPRSLNLEQNFPNPFNPTTTFYYELQEAGAVSLRIISAGGRELITVEREHSVAGRFSYRWDGRDTRGELMPSGVYFYEVQTPTERRARKMIMLQ